MKCPHCQIDLKIADRSGVEIDYCPQCRGVWLDKGELDKIIDRANSFYSEKQDNRENEYEKDYSDKSQQYDSKRSSPQRKKKESWFEEMFDIFGG